MNQYKKAPNYPNPQPAPKRQEIDAVIREIGAVLNKKPEIVVRVLELWVKEPKKSTPPASKKKAA